MPYLVLTVKALLVTVFTVAAIGKLRRPAVFAELLTAISPVPEGAVRAVTVAVPVFEIGAAAALCIPGTGAWGFVPSAVALSAFSMVMAWLAVTRRNLGCACFGRRSERAGWWPVIRNLVLLAAALSGLALGGITTGGGTAAAPGAALAITAGGAMAALIVFAADIAALFGPSVYEGVR